ncbi:MAG: hypothetical protein IIZ60_04280 [Clostridia bacterium]|nr:hypothetical protein [Clostridia bacterium]
MKYSFYGWETADVLPVNPDYAWVGTPRQLYDILMTLWQADTCAPRMRDVWPDRHPSWGQCSITAFLVQDIYGGKVLGVPRDGGNFHCFNQVGDCVFDITSEQFGSETLVYEDRPEQFREVHFAKEEKRLRYELLKQRLEEYKC